jgi:hypothetical protein
MHIGFGTGTGNGVTAATDSAVRLGRDHPEKGAKSGFFGSYESEGRPGDQEME